MPGIDGETLRAWRRSRGWEVPETARQLRGAALETSQTVAEHDGLIRMIYAWERGDHDISERYELLYRKAVGIGEGEPSGDSGRPGLEASRNLLDELAEQAVEFGRWTEATNVGSGTVEQLDDAIRRIAREYLTSPPLPLLRRAAEVNRRVFQLLHDHQRLRHTRDLYVIGAKCCAFLAWTSGDLGQLPAAAAHASTALILAEEAGHPGARALALCSQSKTAFWDGRLKLAADVARRGYESCPPNSTRVLLACQEADAVDLAAAGVALARATGAHEQISREDDLGGVFSCGQVRRANYSVGVHLRAGDPQSALAAANGAAASNGREEVGYGTWGQIQIGAGLAFLQSGELEGAVDRLAPVLVMPAAQRLATLAARMGEVDAMLAGAPFRGERTAAGLSEEIRSYRLEGASARALPAGEETPE